MKIKQSILKDIAKWGEALGFQQVGFSNCDLFLSEQQLTSFLQKNYQGDMHYLSQHGLKRTRPAELIEGTKGIIVVRMDYLPPNANIDETLTNDALAYISRYALGRDYHKLIRKRLKKLGDKIQNVLPDFNFRVFADSAPVMEKPLAEKAGLGWIGKHTNLINPTAGSWFFLGEIYCNVEFPNSEHIEKSHCGDCTKCIDICPTQAIIAPYQLDARRCISYLTIEYHGVIPVEFRSLIGNRIYGCDDCQQVCPWNRFATVTCEKDFFARHGLDSVTLMALFQWTKVTFLKNTEGSAIRRIGFDQWQRNLAVALGNCEKSSDIKSLLEKNNNDSLIVKEHIQWALDKHG